MGEPERRRRRLRSSSANPASPAAPAEPPARDARVTLDPPIAETAALAETPVAPDTSAVTEAVTETPAVAETSAVLDPADEDRTAVAPTGDTRIQGLPAADEPAEAGSAEAGSAEAGPARPGRTARPIPRPTSGAGAGARPAMPPLAMAQASAPDTAAPVVARPTAGRPWAGNRPTSGAGTGTDEREAERGLRGLVGSGSSQVSVGAALRARDAARPTDAQLAEAEERLVIVRRNWAPREDLPRR